MENICLAARLSMSRPVDLHKCCQHIRQRQLRDPGCHNTYNTIQRCLLALYQERRVRSHPAWCTWSHVPHLTYHTSWAIIAWITTISTTLEPICVSLIAYSAELGATGLLVYSCPYSSNCPKPVSSWEWQELIVHLCYVGTPGMRYLSHHLFLSARLLPAFSSLGRDSWIQAQCWDATASGSCVM